KAVGKTLQFVVLLRPLSRPIIFNNSHAFHNLQNVSREHFDDQKVAARQGNDITLLISLVGKYRAYSTPTPLACKGRGSRDQREAASLLAKNDVRPAPSWIRKGPQGSKLQANSPCCAKLRFAQSCCYAATSKASPAFWNTRTMMAHNP